MNNTSIMIVDQNPDYRGTLRHAFENRGYTTWTCPGPDIASSILAAIQPHFVLLDLDMEGQNPMEIIDAWRELAPHTHVIVLMTIPDIHRLREAMDHGAKGFVIKSHSLSRLFKLLDEEMQEAAA